MTTLIGTNPDQIPVNAMLGGMAYQDPDSVNVRDLTSSGTASITNLSYSGTLTGGAGVINIGSGQVYKDASGKIGLNTTNPLSLLHLNQGTSGDGLRFERSGYDVMDIELSENGLRIRNETDGRTDLLINGAGDLSLFGTGAIKIQEGTTAQRPSTPLEGMIRKNSTDNSIEGYVNGSWEQLNGGKLINYSIFSSAGDYTFTKDPLTKTILVKMVGGGGSGATAISGSLGAGNGSAGGAGSPGTYIEFVLDATLSTYYVRVGQGGAAPGAAFQGGSSGTSSIFSENAAFTTDYIASGYGRGGATMGSAPVPFIAEGGLPSVSASFAGNGGLWNVLATAQSGAGTFLVLNSSWFTYINGNYVGSGKFLPATSIFGPPFTAVQAGAGGLGGWNITGAGSNSAYSGNPGAVMILEYA